MTREAYTVHFTAHVGPPTGPPTDSLNETLVVASFHNIFTIVDSYLTGYLANSGYDVKHLTMQIDRTEIKIRRIV